MKSWIEAYRKHLTDNRSLSDNSRQGYFRDLADFAAAMERQGIVETEQLQPRHIQFYLQQLRREGKSAATIARRLVTVRRLCRFGVMERMLAVDPTLGIEAPRQEKKPTRTLRLDEMAKLLDEPGTGEESPHRIRDAAMLELLYASGLRVSELIALDTSHVRTDLGLVHCTGRDGRERIVPVGELAVRKLQHYFAAGRPALLKPDKPDKSEDALFLNHHGLRLTRQGCWKAIRSLAREAGFGEDLSPHMLRRSFAVHLLENGADVRAVQEMLGHASLQSTILYRDAARTKVKEEYDRAHPRAR